MPMKLDGPPSTKQEKSNFFGSGVNRFSLQAYEITINYLKPVLLIILIHYGKVCQAVSPPPNVKTNKEQTL